MRRQSVHAFWNVAAVVGAIAAAVVLSPAAAHAGCTRDSECKGARICENGRCVNPQNSQSGAGASVQPAPAVAPGPGSAPAPMPPPVPAMSAPPAPPPQNVHMPPPMPGSAPTQFAPIPGAPVGATTVSPQPWAGAAPVGAGLTESQLSDLKSAGASLDAKDMEIADRLLRRGFSGDDFVAAYREQNALKLTYPEFGRFGRETVETIAVARKLGLGENDKYWLVWHKHDLNSTLTQAYNEEVVAKQGKALRVVGWIAILTGAVSVLAGTILYIEGKSSSSSSQDDDIGKVMVPVGAVLGAAGAVTLIVGYSRIGRLLAEGTLERTPADRLGPDSQ
jgi:hypothetical protein